AIRIGDPLLDPLRPQSRRRQVEVRSLRRRRLGVADVVALQAQVAVGQQPVGVAGVGALLLPLFLQSAVILLFQFVLPGLHVGLPRVQVLLFRLAQLVFLGVLGGLFRCVLDGLFRRLKSGLGLGDAPLQRVLPDRLHLLDGLVIGPGLVLVVLFLGRFQL